MAVPLFSTLSQRSVTFRNRIGISPMCMYSSTDGFATDFHIAHSGARAIGGAGLFITEATAVVPEGRITPQDMGIWSDDHVKPLTRLTALVREYGTVPGIQLAHAGWKASTRRPWDPAGPAWSDAEGGWTPVAPSDASFDSHSRPAKAIDDPQSVIQAFKAAAIRALAAGYQLVEIHAAHGYLLHSFHSPIANRRTDNYGGSFENRTRLTREVVSAVREVWPENLPLWVRFSCTDYVEGGWTLDESVELARQLKPLGVDTIDCSSGGIVPKASIPVGPGYQVPFAERIKREAGIATAAVGMITTATQANDIIAQGKADITLIARQSLRDPNFPIHTARELGAPAPVPPQYGRSA